MNKISCVFIFVLFSLNVYGQATEAERAKFKEYCESQNTFAKNIMTSRQSGVPLEVVLERLSALGMDQQMERMVLAAYNQHYYSYEDQELERQHAIKEFANTYYAACLMAVSKLK